MKVFVEMYYQVWGVDDTRRLPGHLGAKGLNWTEAIEDDLERRAG
jgi:hypothetical protein